MISFKEDLSTIFGSGNALEEPEKFTNSNTEVRHHKRALYPLYFSESPNFVKDLCKTYTHSGRNRNSVPPHPRGGLGKICFFQKLVSNFEKCREFLFEHQSKFGGEGNVFWKITENAPTPEGRTVDNYGCALGVYYYGYPFKIRFWGQKRGCISTSKTLFTIYWRIAPQNFK